MQSCQQTPTQNVLQHGESVWKFTKQIISGDFTNLKLPDWFLSNHRYIVNNLHPYSIIKEYNIFHDCGKPYCLEVDSQGKQHFPNHTQVSAETYFKIKNDTIVEELIREDMSLHTLTADEITNKEWSRETAFTLLVTAFAEIHSNAQMFGGIDSTSFKIKWKKLDKRGKLLMRLFPEPKYHPYSYVIVRNDLPSNVQAIQGTHAAIEMTKRYQPKGHPSVIYVVVKNEKKLQQVIQELTELGIQFSIFREPDEPFNNNITAICTEPLIGKQRKTLKRFQLLNDIEEKSRFQLHNDTEAKTNKNKMIKAIFHKQK